MCVCVCVRVPACVRACVRLPGTDESSVSKQQVALGSLLDDQHWHQVKVELFKAHFNITLDSNARQTQVPTEPALWDVRQVRPDREPFGGFLGVNGETCQIVT